MTAYRSNRFALAFARETARSATSRLCTACVEVLDVSGAGITIMSGEHAGPICISDSSVAALEDLQYTLGEGPCQDAFRTGRSVHAPRLAFDYSARWPTFVELAQASKIGAVFAYPLATAGANVGVLTLYQHAEGELSDVQHDDSVGIAEVLAETILSLQDEAPAGTLAVGIDDTMKYRAEIYQASGMVSIQLSVPVAEALVRIRAYAFANNEAIGDVASRIVARRLRLPDDHPTREHPTGLGD